MTRWLPVIGVGMLAAIVALLLVRPGPAPTATARAEALAAELRCPDCQGLSVADSPTRSAQEIRRQIDELVAAGASDDEVRAHFVARYGEWVLLAPSSPVLWLVPFGALILGVALLAVWVGRRPAPPERGSGITDEERRRLHDEAEALDA
jgi:cytochrome c-type biogenesis protein CcmH